MNIKQAKEQIRNAVQAYRSRDDFGRIRIPRERQRPVLLMGPPGIGKTAVVQQVAQEMGIGFISYSITHHTRQSALGLPFITERSFGGRSCRISEYTMSEIIAAVYKQMEETGVMEGILFLDEINCVSETLAPAMLQFLQYKVFGQHQVPEGWVVVTAGNPLEYNQSVREFDMVTQDRLKKIDIEPDYEAWRQWAVNEDVHPAVVGYLDVRQEDFYQVQNTVDGMSLVTPRGWVDLSDMLHIYEEEGMGPADEALIGQYLQNDRIARQFAAYYELWKKYEDDYKIGSILDGTFGEEVLDRARKAAFDERASLIGLLLDGEKRYMKEVLDRRAMLLSLKEILGELKAAEDLAARWQEERERVRNRLPKNSGLGLPEEEERRLYRLLAWMEEHTGDWPALREAYDREREELDVQAEKAGMRLENLFRFVEEVFGGEGEMALVITALTSTEISARFISKYGSEGYYRYNKELLFFERKKEILQEINQLL